MNKYDCLPVNTQVNIDNLLYEQVVTDDINVGDLVLDLNDLSYGYIDMRKDDHVAIKDSYCVEIGVPISRVRKLIPSLLNNSTN